MIQIPQLMPPTDATKYHLYLRTYSDLYREYLRCVHSVKTSNQQIDTVPQSGSAPDSALLSERVEPAPARSMVCTMCKQFFPSRNRFMKHLKYCQTKFRARESEEQKELKLKKKMEKKRQQATNNQENQMAANENNVYLHEVQRTRQFFSDLLNKPLNSARATEMNEGGFITGAHITSTLATGPLGDALFYHSVNEDLDDFDLENLEVYDPFHENDEDEEQSLQDYQQTDQERFNTSSLSNTDNSAPETLYRPPLDRSFNPEQTHLSPQTLGDSLSTLFTPSNSFEAEDNNPSNSQETENHPYILGSPQLVVRPRRESVFSRQGDDFLFESNDSASHSSPPDSEYYSEEEEEDENEEAREEMLGYHQTQPNLAYLLHSKKVEPDATYSDLSMIVMDTNLTQVHENELVNFLQ